MDKGGILHLGGKQWSIPVLNLAQVKRYLLLARSMRDLAASDMDDAKLENMMELMDGFAGLVGDLLRVKNPSLQDETVLKMMNFPALPGVIEELALATHGLRRAEPGEQLMGSQSTGEISMVKSSL